MASKIIQNSLEFLNRGWVCVRDFFQSLICIIFQFIQAVMTLSKTTPKSQFRPLGKMHQIFSQCNKNDPKFTLIYEKRLGMCNLPFKILICIMFQFIQAVMTLSKQLPSHNFDPWGKCTKSSPNAIIMSKIASNA